MKTLLVFLFVTASALAQDFVVTTAGIVSKGDRTKNYVIATFKGVPADSLYSNTKKYFREKYTSPTDIIRADEQGALLSLQTKDITMATLATEAGPLSYVVSCSIIVEFKDGKVRITYANVDAYTINEAKDKSSVPFSSLYDSKGKVADKRAKNVIESHFNATTRLLLRGISGVKTKVSSDW